MLKNPGFNQALDGYDNEQVETPAVEPVTEEFANEQIEEIEE